MHAWAQNSLIPHRPEASHQVQFPPLKALDKQLSCLFGPIRQRARQGANRATADSVVRSIEPHDLVAPPAQVFQGLNTGQAARLEAKNAVRLRLHDGAHQRFFIREVVIDLRLAGPAGLHDIVQCRAIDATSGDELSGNLDDTRPGRLPACGYQRSRSLCSAGAHIEYLSTIGLDSPISILESRGVDRRVQPSTSDLTAE